MKDFAKKHREGLLLTILAVVCAVSLWISGRTSLSSPKELGLVGVAAFQSVGDAIGEFFSSTFTSIQKLSELQADYDALRTRMGELEAATSDASALRDENRRLREVLGFSGALSYQNVPAQLIGKAPGLFFASLTINKGYNQGIRRGMPVITMQDANLVLVGKVELVSPDAAVVQPLFSDTMYITARLDSSRYEGLVKGSGFAGDPLVMQYIAANAQSQLRIGDTVSSSGVNSRYPGGLRIGSVSAISSRPYENTLELEVKAAVDFSRLEYMYVLIIPIEQDNAGLEDTP